MKRIQTVGRWVGVAVLGAALLVFAVFALVVLMAAAAIAVGGGVLGFGVWWLLGKPDVGGNDDAARDEVRR